MADPIITSPDQLADGVVERSKLGWQAVNAAKVAPGAIDGTRLSSYFARLRSFRGRSGPGPIGGFVGLGIGDRVVSVVCLTDPGDALGAFEPVVTVAGQIQQVSGFDLSGKIFLAITILVAA